MSDAASVHGLWCATLTPLNREGRVAHARLAAHVRELLQRGVDGVVVFGTTGEGPSFSVAERTATVDALLAAGVPPARMVVATGCAALPDTVALTRHALASGCPRCLVLPPYFWKDMDDDGLFGYYAALIETVGDARLRVYLYHIPNLSAAPIRPALVARLAAAYPGILAGVKDSGGDVTHTRALLACTPALAILTGHEPHLPQLMRAGGAGTICGTANLYPGLMAALLDPDVSEAAERQVQCFLDIVRPYPFVPAFKAIRAAQTGDAAWCTVRPPLTVLSKPERDTLLAALSKAKLLDVR